MARAFQTIFALSLFLFLSCLINGAVARTTLHQNDYLLQNENLTNGYNALLMDLSCNLILYNGNKEVWATNTSGKANHSCWAELLLNGDLIVFGDNKILWSSDSDGVIGQYQLVLLDSGNIAVFYTCPEIWSPNIEKKAVKVDDRLKPIWSPKIGKKALRVDDDHKPIWSTDIIKKFENRYLAD